MSLLCIERKPRWRSNNDNIYDNRSRTRSNVAVMLFETRPFFFVSSLFRLCMCNTNEPNHLSMWQVSCYAYRHTHMMSHYSLSLAMCIYLHWTVSLKLQVNRRYIGLLWCIFLYNVCAFFSPFYIHNIFCVPYAIMVIVFCPSACEYIAYRTNDVCFIFRVRLFALDTHRFLCFFCCMMHIGHDRCAFVIE